MSFVLYSKTIEQFPGFLYKGFDILKTFFLLWYIKPIFKMN